jgi:hypothetical protein
MFLIVAILCATASTFHLQEGINKCVLCICLFILKKNKNWTRKRDLLIKAMIVIIVV